MNKVAIVGFGMADVLGFDPETCWNKMLDPHDYSSEIPQLIDDPYCSVKCGAVIDFKELDKRFDDTFPRKEMRSMTNAQKLMLYTTDRAMKMSGLEPHPDVAVIQSSVSNDTEFLESYYPAIYEQKHTNIRKAVNRIPDIGNHHICSHFGFRGMSTSTFASCATGIVSMDYAMRIADEYEYVVVGGADAGCFGMGVKYFTLLQATADKSMPFDDERCGFMMGDGAATLILMSEEKAKAKGINVIAWLYPAGGASDGSDLTNPDGEGSIRSMTKAMRNVDSVDAVCAHATSTPNGDPVEYIAISNMFGAIPTFAPKSKIGHTLAAAGVIETVYSILAMQNKTLPHIQNLRTCSFDDQDMLVYENTHLASSKPRIINNSFGFGGKCMSQVVELN